MSDGRFMKRERHTCHAASKHLAGKPRACRLIGREKPEVWISDPTRSIVLQVI